eukprot:g31156.t1
MRVHVLLTLALAEAAQWPAQVIQSCGFSSPNAVVSDVEGSLTLSVPKLCGATLAGLKPQQYGQWGTWLGNAFAHCPDLTGFEPKASTSYPDAGGIRFLVSGTGTAHDNAKIEQCLGSNMQASSGLSWSRITVSNFGISKVESEPLFQIGMKNFMILLRFGAVILVALGLYGIVADPEFPPNDNSLGKLKGDTAGGLIHQGGGTDWVRAAEIAEKDGEDHRGAQLFDGGIEASDLLQGALGDCWLSLIQMWDC